MNYINIDLYKIFEYYINMTNWLDVSNNANTLSSTYLQGMLDISGSITSRNSTQSVIIGGDVSFNNNLHVGKDVSLNQNIFIYGDISWNPTNLADNSILPTSIINIEGIVSNSLVPDTNEIYDLGSNSKRFKDLYLSAKTLHIGNSSISATEENAINLPSSSTINNGQIGGITIKGLVPNESALTNLTEVSSGDTYIAEDTHYGYIAKIDNADTLSDWLNISSIEGAIGTTGPFGNKGDKGVIGVQGIEGSNNGLIGPKGQKGDPFLGNGVTGPKGNVGIIGVTGFTMGSAIKGEPGIIGNKGSLGENGSIGNKGVVSIVKGSTGSSGLIGESGEKGSLGITGPFGPINSGSNITLSKTMFVENDVSLNKDVDINGQTYIYSFVKDATLYGGSTDISSVMGQFPALGLNHSVSNANLWRSTYTKTVDSYTGNDIWKNGDYTVSCSDFNAYYGAYSNPENAFNNTTTDSQQNHKYHWSANGVIPINYTDAGGNTQTLTDYTMNQWIALELPIHVKVTSWTCYSRGFAGKNWHLLGRERKSGLIRDLHIGTQNYGLTDGNPSYKNEYTTNNVTTDIFVDKLYFVFNGNLDARTSISIANINFTGEMMPNQKTGLIVHGDTNITGTFDIGSFDLSTNNLTYNSNELTITDISVLSDINNNILVSTNNATNLSNMDVSKNLTFDDNSSFVVQPGVEIHMNNDVYVNKNASLENDLYVKGNIISDGSINLTKYNSNYIIKSDTNNYQVNTIETFEVKKDIKLEDDSTISQHLFINEDVSINNNVFIKEDIVWDSTKLSTNSIYKASLIGGGITGPIGILGSKGEVGSKGSTHENGYIGNTGVIGPQGSNIQGEQGDKGIVSNTNGPKGMVGNPEQISNLTLDGSMHVNKLSISNDLSWNPSTTNFANNIINLHSLSGYQADMPNHSIALWSGNSTSIPNEWKICDGQYNTPDLRSKFVIGHDSRDASFNNDMSGASYLIFSDNSNNSHPKRRAFFIGDISDNGNWIDVNNGTRHAIDIYNDNVFYKLTYIMKNPDIPRLYSNDLSINGPVVFSSDFSFNWQNYNADNSIELRSIIPIFNETINLFDTSFNRDLSINQLNLGSNFFTNNATVNNLSVNSILNSSSLNINNVKNVIVGDINIPPISNTERSINYEDVFYDNSNTIKSNRNEFDGNINIKTQINSNKQNTIDLIDPLSSTQNAIEVKDYIDNEHTLGRFGAMTSNGDGNIIAYGSKLVESTDYPNVEGKIIIKKLDENDTWQNYGNEIITKFSSVDLNDDGTILAIGNKYADNTATIKQDISFNLANGNNTCDEHGYYVFARQYTNYKIYQDGEVKLYKYNRMANTWNIMNTDTGSSIVPFEPFQAFGNLVKLNKKGNRILIAPEGHGGYNASGTYERDYNLFSTDFPGANYETRFRIAHAYEYNSNNNRWERLGTPINVWDGKCCGYDEYQGAAFWPWECRHSPDVGYRTEYTLDSTLRTYDEHKSNADSLGKRLATITTQDSINKISQLTTEGVFVNHKYDYNTQKWSIDQSTYPTGVSGSYAIEWNTLTADVSNSFIANNNWEIEKISNDISFIPMQMVAEVRNISGTKKISSISKHAYNYAIYEYVREFIELKNTYTGALNGTYIQAGEELPYFYGYNGQYLVFLQYFQKTTERYYYFVNELYTFDEHITRANTIYNNENDITQGYFHQHLTNALGAPSNDSRGKPFRSYQRVASPKDGNEFTQIVNALGSNTSAFIDSKYEPYSTTGWTSTDVDFYNSLNDPNSLSSYNNNSTYGRKRGANQITTQTFPSIHYRWHANEPKQLYSTLRTPNNIFNIYKEGGIIRISGQHHAFYNNSAINVQAGYTYLFYYNTEDIHVTLNQWDDTHNAFQWQIMDENVGISRPGAQSGEDKGNLGTSGYFYWTVPSTYNNNTTRTYWYNIGVRAPSSTYFGRYTQLNIDYGYISIKVTTNVPASTTDPYRLGIKNGTFFNTLKDDNIKLKAVYEDIVYNNSVKNVHDLDEFPNGTLAYPGAARAGNSTVDQYFHSQNYLDEGMFSGVEKLHVKIDSMSFNDEGTIAAFGLTGIGQRERNQKGMFRGAAIVCRLKNRNVGTDASFNNIIEEENRTYSNYANWLRPYKSVPHNNPDNWLNYWERIGIINGVNNMADTTTSSVGFKYVGHFGNNVKLNGPGNILAVSARDSNYYSNDSNFIGNGIIPTIGSNYDITNGNGQSMNQVGGNNLQTSPTDSHLGGLNSDKRAGYVQVFQYANDTGDIITESHNPGSNDRWNQLGGSIIPQDHSHRCGAGLAMNKEGDIISVGSYTGYTEGQVAHVNTRKKGMIRTFSYRYLTLEERHVVIGQPGHWDTGKAQLGDASGNYYENPWNIDLTKKHWIQVGKNFLDFMGFNHADGYIAVNGSVGGGIGRYTFTKSGVARRTKIANEMYPLNYHHYDYDNWTTVENTNYHTNTLFDGNYTYDDEMMNKLFNYYGKWDVLDCNIIMNQNGTKFITNTFCEKNSDYYHNSIIRVISINPNHFQNVNNNTNQYTSKLLINKEQLSKPTINDAINDVEYNILDVSGNIQISQNISSNSYKSIRSIEVDIGTNNSTSKTVYFTYGKNYENISNLAFNVNVYSDGNSDNKPIDATIYNYDISGAYLFVEVSYEESDKTWSYSLKASIVIFETQEFNAVYAAPSTVTDYGQLSLYPPENVPVSGDDGHASFQGELSGKAYGNGIYKIYTKRPQVQGNVTVTNLNADSRYNANGTWKIQTLMDRNMSTNVWMEHNNNRRDIYFLYEFPDSVYVRRIEVWNNTSPYCKVDIWKNTGSLYYDSSYHTIYDGSITTNTGSLVGANLLTMNDHSYQSNKLRVRLHGGSQDIQIAEILFFVTGI